MSKYPGFQFSKVCETEQEILNGFSSFSNDLCEFLDMFNY